MEFDDLIGLEESKARNILSDFGYNKVETIINSKYNSKCNTKLVCGVKQNDDVITLVCGEFYIIGK